MALEYGRIQMARKRSAALNSRREQKTTARRSEGGASLEQALKSYALWYLGRYPATRARLRHHLARRAARYRDGADDGGGQDCGQVIEALMAELQRLGLVDDRRFARDRARALMRRGTPPAAIAARLREAGLEDADIEAAGEAIHAAEGDAELAAAVAWARRRRLGPFAPSERAEERRERDLAAFARRGFSYAVSVRVLDAATPEELAEATALRGPAPDPYGPRSEG